MPAPRKPQKLIRKPECSETCTLGSGIQGEERAALIHSWLEAAFSDTRVIAEAKAAGFKLSLGAIGRHRSRHIRPWVKEDSIMTEEMAAELTDLEILRLVIRQGAKNVAGGARVDTKTMMQALDMYYKMTQGSMLADMFSALASAAMEEELSVDDEADMIEATAQKEDLLDDAEPSGR